MDREKLVEDAALPKAEVEFVSSDSFKVHLKRIRTEMLHDQGTDLQVDGQGCVSAPGGPSC